MFSWVLRTVPAVQEELKDFFPTLLDFAEMLSSAAPDTTRMAGAALYASLFLQFESCFHRQVEEPLFHCRLKVLYGHVCTTGLAVALPCTWVPVSPCCPSWQGTMCAV